MLIYLIRHGETTGDVEDRYGGDYDDHLTDLGKSQAKDLADKLQGKGIERVFVSPKIRAQETAQILSTTLSIKMETVQDLRERNQNGVLTGMLRAEAKQQYPDLVELLKDFNNTIKGAEDYPSFSRRVESALKLIVKQPCSKIAVVTHGGPIKAILRLISYSPDYKIEDCAFAELETDNDKLKLVSLNGIVATN